MLRQLLLSEPDFRGGEGAPAAAGAFALLTAEFPTIAVQPLAEGKGARVLHLDAQQWRAPGFDPFDWDERVFGAADGEPHLALHLVGAQGRALACVAMEVLTRYQGLIVRRNAASRSPLFEQLLCQHQAIHDLSKPLLLADHRHALDTWQWTLRLEPEADLAVQVAALFHDVERLITEADERIEHHASDYQAFKDAHAARGADVACTLLRELGVDACTCERVRALVSRHEHTGGADASLTLLNDADALSFFSLNASGFARYFPPEHLRRKVAYTLERLSPSQRWRLAHIRLAPEVRRCLDAALGEASSPTAYEELA